MSHGLICVRSNLCSICRPKEFAKQPVAAADSDSEEESRVGKMPSSDESDA